MMKISVTLAAIWALPGAAMAGLEAKDIDRSLERIVAGKGPTDPLAGAALAIFEGERLIYAGAAGCAEFASDGKSCERALEPPMKLRVASISNLAVALGLKTLIDDNQIDPDKDVSAYLGWPLRNPNFPDRVITARQLLSLTSSIRDAEEYWVNAPGTFSGTVR